MKNNKDSKSVRPFGLQFLEVPPDALDGVGGGKKNLTGIHTELKHGRSDFEN